MHFFICNGFFLEQFCWNFYKKDLSFCWKEISLSVEKTCETIVESQTLEIQNNSLAAAGSEILFKTSGEKIGVDSFFAHFEWRSVGGDVIFRFDLVESQ